MTILSALDTHYARLEFSGVVAPFGFSTESISFALVLSVAGEVVSCHDLRDFSGQRPTGRPMPVPRSFWRSGTIPRAFFLWDNSKFVLGLGLAREGGGVADYPAHAAAFRELHERLLEGTADPGLLAVLRFLRSWTPERFGQEPFGPGLLNRNLVFQLDGDSRADGSPRFVHDRPVARAIWERQVAGSGRPLAVCLVTGRTAPTARLHPAIKGVWDAQPSGAALISFNLNAFTSYGKEQGDNAPISEAAAFHCGAALNALLARDSRTKLQIGDTTTVFWADASVHGEASARKAEALVARALAPLRPRAASNDTSEGEREEVRRLRQTLVRVRDPRAVEWIHPDLDPGTRLYILGLAPNRSRLSVRFWHATTLGALLARLAEHWNDLTIEPPAWKGLPSVEALLCSIARQEEAENIPPLLGGELMRAILTGDRYPRTLLAAVIMRLRAGGPVTGARAALCRAILQRDARWRCRPEEPGRGASTDKAKGVPVSLDRQELDPAYRLGRLFALLENMQRAALGPVNASIRDRYFGAASATPASVFPLLLRNANHHLAALRKDPRTGGLAVWFECEVNGIMDGLAMSLPRHLRLESQGRFAVGYYHQRCAKKSEADAADADAPSPVPSTDKE